MRIQHIAAGLALCALASCSKQISINPLSFDVQADSASYNAASLTTFSFSGKPNNITFFSGEIGKRFEFKNRVTADNGIPQLKFSSALNAGAQPNSLALMVSSNYTPSSDPAAIGAATWTDISSRAAWATSGTAVASGAVDLSDMANAGKPVYIAFKYKVAAGAIQDKWTITGVSLRNVLPDGTAYTIDTLPTFTTVTNYGNTTNLPGWAGQAVANTYKWTLSAANLVIAGATTAAAATAPAEAWAITGPINLKTVTPDLGTVIQNMSDNVQIMKYSYAKPGTYTATFLASNVNVDGMNSITKNLAISIK